MQQHLLCELHVSVGIKGNRPSSVHCQCSVIQRKYNADIEFTMLDLESKLRRPRSYFSNQSCAKPRQSEKQLSFYTSLVGEWFIDN